MQKTGLEQQTCVLLGTIIVSQALKLWTGQVGSIQADK